MNRVSLMGSIFFAETPVSDFKTAKASDAGRFKQYYKAMRARGIYLAPSPFEAAFISTAHTEELIEKTLRAAAGAFEEMSR